MYNQCGIKLYFSPGWQRTSNYARRTNIAQHREWVSVTTVFLMVQVQNYHFLSFFLVHEDDVRRCSVLIFALQCTLLNTCTPICSPPTPPLCALVCVYPAVVVCARMNAHLPTGEGEAVDIFYAMFAFRAACKYDMGGGKLWYQFSQKDSACGKKCNTIATHLGEGGCK